MSTTPTPRPAPRRRTALRWAARAGAGVASLLVLVAAGGYGASEWRARTRYAVPAHPFTAPGDAAAAERGARLVRVRGCVDCHGEALGGRVLVDDPIVGRLAGPNLTSGRPGGALTDADWERAVRHGVRRDGTPLRFMPSAEYAGTTDEDLGAIVAHVRRLPAVTTPTPGTRAGPLPRGLDLAGAAPLHAAALIDHARPHPARLVPAPTAEYGAYLAVGCTGCHGPGFSGGPIPGGPPDWKPAANITPTGIGHYSDTDFTRLMRTGRRPDGTMVDPVMPWRLLRDMDDVELQALRAYLRTVAPRPTGTR